MQSLNTATRGQLPLTTTGKKPVQPRRPGTVKNEQINPSIFKNHTSFSHGNDRSLQVDQEALKHLQVNAFQINSVFFFFKSKDVFS